MSCFLLRGALIVLPVFFWFVLEGGAPARAVGYYRAFYDSIGSFSSWVSSDRTDRSKDLFLARYRLPLKGRTAAVIPVSPQRSLTDDDVVYLPVHVEVPAKRTITFVLDGVVRGSLMVNGEPKGVFDLGTVRGYIEARISFAPGVYSLLFSVERYYPDLPLVVIADQPVTLATRGFTKNFSAAVSLVVREKPDGVLHDRLWETRCLPAPSSDDRFVAVWRRVFEVGVEEEEPWNEKTTPLLVLLKHSENEKAKTILLKAGFTEEMLAWWRERLSVTEVCRDNR